MTKRNKELEIELKEHIEEVKTSINRHGIPKAFEYFMLSYNIKRAYFANGYPKYNGAHLFELIHEKFNTCNIYDRYINFPTFSDKREDDGTLTENISISELINSMAMYLYFLSNNTINSAEPLFLYDNYIMRYLNNIPERPSIYTDIYIDGVLHVYDWCREKIIDSEGAIKVKYYKDYIYEILDTVYIDKYAPPVLCVKLPDEDEKYWAKAIHEDFLDIIAVYPFPSKGLSGKPFDINSHESSDTRVLNLRTTDYKLLVMSHGEWSISKKEPRNVKDSIEAISSLASIPIVPTMR